MPPLSTMEFAALDALKCTVAYNRYGAYCVPLSSSHRPAAQAVLAGEVYEPNTVEFMRAHAGTGDVVHAGTYFGDFIPALSRGLAPGARLWAFEPAAENHHCARVTVLLNELDNVELRHAALGAHAGEQELLTTDADGAARGGSSRLVPPGTEGPGYTETTAVVTVDGCVPADRTVGILQLDVEGHELHALAGALGTIRRCRPILILEILDGSTLLADPWFREQVLGLGYRQVGSLHGNAVLRPA